MNTTEQRLLVPDVLAVTGATYRQLCVWTTRGFLHPVQPDGPGSGRPRTWPAEELGVARAMARYVAAGVTPSAAHHAARHDGVLPGASLRIVAVAT